MIIEMIILCFDYDIDNNFDDIIDDVGIDNYNDIDDTIDTDNEISILSDT